MGNLEEKFDQFRDDLLGTEKIHPGILIRMDEDIRELKANPIIIFGNHLRFAVTALLTVGAVAFALANVQTVLAIVANAVRGK